MAKKSFSFDRIVNKPETKASPTPEKKVVDPTPKPIEESKLEAKEATKAKPAPAPPSKKVADKPVVKAKQAPAGKRKYDIRQGQQKIDKDLVNSVGRKKFTTMIRPDLRNLLDNIAHNNNISVAQLLEDILDEYFGVNQ